ncbi:MAG: tetratricopeptide repeat protein, partial [Phycisphaerales bacterium]
LKVQDPNSLAVTAAQIRLSIRQGKPAEALRLSEDMANKLNNASAYILRARTYAALGQSGRAAEDLERAASVEPDNAEVWVARSDFYGTLGQAAEAIIEIEQALSLAPDNVQIQKRAISLFLASREPDRIRDGKVLLERALESNEDDMELRLFKARSLLGEGTAPAAKSAERILQEITADQPEISEAWVLLGEIAIKRRQPAEAMDAALGGLAYKPTDKALLLLKARAEAARSPVLAVQTLKGLHELDPNDVEAAVLLANTYIKAGEPKKAEVLLRKQLTTCNVSTRRRYEVALAVALYKNGNKGKAENDLDSLLESEPNDPSPLLAHVQLLRDDQLWNRLSQKVIDWYKKHPADSRTPVTVARDLIAAEDNQAKKAAEDVLRTMLEDNSDCVEALSGLAILLEITGRSEESAELYQRLLELKPDNLIAINNLAWIMCEVQGKHQQSLELAQRGLQIAPNYVDLIDTRGVVYYRLGEFDKAIQDFRTCIKLYPSTAPAAIATRFHAARAFAELGQEDNAIAHLTQALDLESRIGGLSTADLAEAQRLLKRLEEGS